MRTGIRLSPGERRKKYWLNAIFHAHTEGTPIDSTAAAAGDLSLDGAYEVQRRLVQKLLRPGDRIIGWKVGATSRAVMEQLKIEEPIFGCMTSRSVHHEADEVRASDFCRLAVEPEIAIVLGKPLRGPGITHAEVMAAASGAMGSVELVDCRFRDWKACLTEAVADNAFHAGVILRPVPRDISGLDLVHEGVVMRKNGRLLGSACGVEALGSPLHVVAWLANKLSQFGLEIAAGEIISTGSLLPYQFVAPGDVVDVSYGNLGQIQLSVSE